MMYAAPVSSECCVLFGELIDLNTTSTTAINTSDENADSELISSILHNRCLFENVEASLDVPELNRWASLDVMTFHI